MQRLLTTALCYASVVEEMLTLEMYMTNTRSLELKNTLGEQYADAVIEMEGLEIELDELATPRFAIGVVAFIGQIRENTLKYVH